MKYVYPAVFTPEDGGFSVFFPDLEGCYTTGDDLADALYMAADVLAFTLYDYEKRRKIIPAPSTLSDIETTGDEFVNFIACDTIEYQKRNNNRAVKKTLSIPEWLNEAAIAKGINFSQVLQDGLKAQLGL
ncbi:MAG: type II toxin-antitoxin system HicB family antitoxin [Mogibacterium sp.]|nr:type II toxin-antitoxin system HicB family antitoxin [Mogibacterium sp.]